MNMKRPAEAIICVYCNHYTFRERQESDKERGWAFCKKHGKWFPDQITGIPAGKRTCSKWE
jgi:hypothetical protein